MTSKSLQTRGRVRKSPTDFFSAMAMQVCSGANATRLSQGSGRAKTVRIHQKLAISEVFYKKTYFGARKALEALGDLKTY